MSQGLEVVLDMKKPRLAVVFRHRRFNKAASDGHAAGHREVHEDLKEILSVNGRNSCPTLSAGVPSASLRIGLLEHSPPVVRSGRSVRGRKSFSRSLTGGCKGAICEKCSPLGQPTYHLFRV